MIKLYKPFMPQLPLMDEILHSGALASGKYTTMFENALKEFFGQENLIVTNSFNTAISVALSALGFKYGDEIIASPMACLASTQPFASSGIKMVWADIDPHTGTLSPESVCSKITSRTKAILHNQFCGIPGYIDEINHIAHEHGIISIDDGIECFGSKYKGKLIGNCGTDVTIFSFTAVRHPNTIDGGAVIFKDRSVYEKSLLIRDCGIDRRIFRDANGEINPECDIKLVGFSATMSNVNGYIGYCQMQHTDEIFEKRHKNAAFWDSYFKENSAEGYRPIHPEHGQPNFWVYGILAPDKTKAVLSFREKGYYASGVHINNNRYQIFGDYEKLPGVEDFYCHFVALPCGWWM